MKAIEDRPPMEVFMPYYVALLYSYQFEERFESVLTYFEGIRLTYLQLGHQSSNFYNEPRRAFIVAMHLSLESFDQESNPFGLAMVIEEMINQSEHGTHTSLSISITLLLRNRALELLSSWV